MALVSGTTLDRLTGDQVRQLQQFLVSMGYNPGPVDGIMGPNTMGAYQRFIAANGNGDPNVIDYGVVAALGGDPDAINVMRRGREFETGWGQKVTGAGGGGVNAATNVVQNAPTPEPVNNTTTTDVSGGGGAVPGTTSGAVDDASVDAWVRDHMPSMAGYLAHPEIGPILKDAAKLGWSEAQLLGAIQKTTWYQTTGEAIRSWDLLVATDPASAQAQVKAKAVELGNLVSRLGFNWDAGTTEWAATQALRENWTADQLNRWLGAIVRNDGVGAGTIKSTAAQVKQLAGKYMASFSEQDALEYSTRIMEDRTTLDSIETTLREQAANRFYWLRDQIGRGITPEQLFQPVKQSVAQTLEMNPDDIDLNTTKWSALVGPVKGDDGLIRSMNFNEAMTWARKQTEWRNTANANATASEAASGLLRTLGAIA